MERIRVVIVEDESQMRAALADLIRGDPSLELLGTAGDAEEAVRLARRSKPDVALIDVRIPGGGGKRAAREIREGVPSARVVAITAFEDRDAILDMLRAGAVGYLTKDTPPNRILQAIRFAAEGQSLVSRKAMLEIVKELIDSAERSERLAGELARLDQHKRDLIQILAHELRTPVTVIRGAMTMLQRVLKDHLTPELNELTQSALRASARITRLAGNVVAASRLDREDVDLPSRPVRVGALLERAGSEFSEQSDRLRLLSPEAENLEVPVDLDLATSALVAVLENALAFSPEDEGVEVTVHAGETAVEILISDRGPGIPPEAAEWVFRPFTQVDSTTTREHQGLGIGLYLAARVMSAHRGKIQLDRRDGGGTTAVLTFPRLRQQEFRG